MSEVYNNMYVSKNDTLKPIKEEVDLDEAQVLAHGGKGQYKVTSGGGVTTVKFKGKVVSSGDFDQGADGWFMNIKGEKGQKFFDTAQEMADYFAKNKITEEADLDEGTWHIAKNMNALKKKIQKPLPKGDLMVKFVMKHIGDDELMDDMFDAKQGTDMVPMIKSAMKRLNIAEEVECDCDCGKSPCEKCGQDHHGIVEAVSMAQQAAIAISKKERGNKPKKEEVKLDELKPPSRHVGKSQKNPDMFAVYDQEEKEVELFKDKKDAEEYAVKNHDALMGHDKPKNVKEEVDLDEHKGKKPHEHPHPKDVDEASARADAMKAMRKGKSIDPADVDDTATDDDVKAASKNIMMQLRKAINLRGTMAVEFGDKKKVKVSAKIAQAATSKYNSFRRPADKEKFQAKIAKSYKDMLQGIKESTIKESKFGVINKQLKGEK